jgi:hypothetical protein
MSSLMVQKVGEDQYTLVGLSGVGRQAQSSDLKVFTWDELREHIVNNTPYPPRIFPTLKAQLENGQPCSLNFPPDASQMPKPTI